MMTDSERLCLKALLSELRPECAIEIGTYRGGSLEIISKYSKMVYTIDIDPTCRDMLKGRLSNVHFITGSSQETLPPLLAHIQQSNEPLGFMLLDAGNTEKTVRRDIETILKFTPTRPLYILIHSSFNPDCRKAILTADWSSNPYVHLIESDFIGGRFITKEEPKNYRQMWEGFALAILLPEKRKGDVIIHQNEFLMFQTAYWRSIYPYQKFRNAFYIKPKSFVGQFLKKYFPGLYNSIKNALN
jgi:hypothetical protein